MAVMDVEAEAKPAVAALGPQEMVISTHGLSKVYKRKGQRLFLRTTAALL